MLSRHQNVSAADEEEKNSIEEFKYERNQGGGLEMKNAMFLCVS